MAEPDIWIAKHNFTKAPNTTQISLVANERYQHIPGNSIEGWAYVTHIGSNEQGYAPVQYFQTSSPSPTPVPVTTSSVPPPSLPQTHASTSRLNETHTFRFQNIPPELTESELNTLCNNLGTVKHVRILSPNQYHKAPAAFVTMSQLHSVDAFLVAANTSPLRGVLPHVTLVRDHELKEQRNHTPRPKHENTASNEADRTYSAVGVVVKTFPATVTDDEVRECFSDLHIQSLRLVKAKGDESNQVAYIDFRDSNEQEKAMARDGKLFLGGKKLHICMKYTIDNKQRNPRPHDPPQRSHQTSQVPKQEERCEQPPQSRANPKPKGTSKFQRKPNQARPPPPVSSEPHLADSKQARQCEILIKNLPTSTSIQILSALFSAVSIDGIRFIGGSEADGAKTALLTLSDPLQRHRALQIGESMQLEGVRQVVSVWEDPSPQPVQQPIQPTHTPIQPVPYPKQAQEPPRPVHQNVQVQQSSYVATSPAIPPWPDAHPAYPQQTPPYPPQSLSQFVSPLHQSAPSPTTQTYLPPPAPPENFHSAYGSPAPYTSVATNHRQFHEMAQPTQPSAYTSYPQQSVPLPSQYMQGYPHQPQIQHQIPPTPPFPAHNSQMSAQRNWGTLSSQPVPNAGMGLASTNPMNNSHVNTFGHFGMSGQQPPQYSQYAQPTSSNIHLQMGPGQVLNNTPCSAPNSWTMAPGFGFQETSRAGV
ncbi:hypothetical protein BLNAU_14717 [Blattamonas nauphoetae]|uniref:RRM domain-containing protein n=1 Tax=Blattamonas nauphoetae TaxID=2049346 RepID=A0ABQ9XIC2_9EUKA|nr:hypothetical protein BLNAU_14717 [Blattamonas nauphoetae]